MDSLLYLGNNDTEKYLCMFSVDAIFGPEYFQVMSDGDKEGHPRRAISLAHSEQRAQILAPTGKRWAFW